MKRKWTLMGMIAVLVLGSLVACSSQETEPMYDPQQQQDQGVSTEPQPMDEPPAEDPMEAVPSTGGIGSETETEEPAAPVLGGDQGTTEMAPEAPTEGEEDPTNTQGQ
ncbi:hypothetical protein [Ammoniphilus sp. YIM 78166]|uniref:hypothetical protein n=1 Tax=Ammoniphilus sp. YIM 78166 TaxID=1644106 RepID=UPI00106F8077|nr:hypothetical protein [Ammoniphilus sp. YIM 78166]